MKTYYDDFAEELSRSFPETPESFRQAVSREVKAHTVPARGRDRRKRRSYKVLFPLAACLILAGSTAAAANLPVFQKWLAGMGINKKAVEESIIHEEEITEPVSAETAAGPEADALNNAENPLFTVTEAYFDGSTLMFWVKPESAYFELGDHVYINGFDSRLEYVAETEAGSGIYECKVTVVNEELQKADPGALCVEAGVYTAPGQKTEYSFTIESDKFGATAQTGGSISDLSYGRIVSYDVTVSTSVMNVKLNWEVSEESMLESLQYGEYILEDASGKRLNPNEWARSRSCSVPEQNEAGRTTFTQELEIIGFDASSPSMTLIPVRVGWDEEGLRIPDSEDILEDCAFTIDLTK